MQIFGLGEGPGYWRQSKFQAIYQVQLSHVSGDSYLSCLSFMSRDLKQIHYQRSYFLFGLLFSGLFPLHSLTFKMKHTLQAYENSQNEYYWSKRLVIYWIPNRFMALCTLNTLTQFIFTKIWKPVWALITIKLTSSSPFSLLGAYSPWITRKTHKWWADHQWSVPTPCTVLRVILTKLS